MTPKPVIEGNQSKWHRTRRALIVAAKEIVIVKNIDSISISDVARETGMSRGTFYNYFDTIEDVLEAGAAELVDELSMILFEANQDYDDRALHIIHGIRYFFERGKLEPAWGWFIIRYGPASQPMQQRLYNDLRSILERGIQAGRFIITEEQIDAVNVLVRGTVLMALRLILTDRASETLEQGVIVLVLQALGISPVEAAVLSRRPLPESLQLSSNP